MGDAPFLTNLDAVIERKRRSGEPFSREEIDHQRLVAPAVSVITDALVKRPQWQKGQPFAVPPDLFKEAREEMTKIMKKRGFGLPVSNVVKAENFVLFGTAIVAA